MGYWVLRLVILTFSFSAVAADKKSAVCMGLLLAGRQNHFISSLTRKNTSEAIKHLQKFRMEVLQAPSAGPNAMGLDVSWPENSDPSKNQNEAVAQEIRGLEQHYLEVEDKNSLVDVVAGAIHRDGSSIEEFYKDYNNAFQDTSQALQSIQKHEALQLGGAVVGSLVIFLALTDPDIIQTLGLWTALPIALSPDTFIRGINSFDLKEKRFQNKLDGFFKALESSKKPGWYYNSRSYAIPNAILQNIWKYGTTLPKEGPSPLKQENAGLGERLAYLALNAMKSQGSLFERLSKAYGSYANSQMYVTIDRLFWFDPDKNEISHTIFYRFSPEPLFKSTFRIPKLTGAKPVFLNAEPLR